MMESSPSSRNFGMKIRRYVRFDPEFTIREGRDGTCVYVGLSENGIVVAVKRVLTHTSDDWVQTRREC